MVGLGVVLVVVVRCVVQGCVWVDLCEGVWVGELLVFLGMVVVV